MPSVLRPALRLTALRSAGLQQGSGSQTDPAGEEEPLEPPPASGRSCAARETSQSAGRSTASSSSSDRSRAFIYTGSSSAHFLLPHLGRTSAAGDGLNPVWTRRSARPSSPALLRSLRLTRPRPPGTPAADSQHHQPLVSFLPPRPGHFFTQLASELAASLHASSRDTCLSLPSQPSFPPPEHLLL